MKDFIYGRHLGIKDKGVSKETALKWNYTVEKINGVIVEISTYLDKSNDLIAQKINHRDGRVELVGDFSKAQLYGQWLFNGGKKLIVVKDELDALSVAQINEYKYPVVAFNPQLNPKDSLKKELEWIETFSEVVFLLPKEDRKIAEDCSSLLSPGKAKIASLNTTVNDYLINNKGYEVTDAIFKAKTHRLDGIVNSRDILDLVKVKPVKGLQLPYPEFNKMTLGIRKKELWVVCAGSSVGKSSWFAEVAYEIAVNQNKKIAYIALEESVGQSGQRFISIKLNKPIHINRDGVDDTDIEKAFDETLASGNVEFYDHFGSLESENLISKIRYLIKACGCEYVFLDHISMAVSGLSDGDERRIIDNLMTKLRSLVEETGAWLGVISHLTRSKNGASHEEGGQTSLSQLRGSHSIAQLADMVIGIERDLQSSEVGKYSKLRILKNRYTGQCGVADTLRFNPVTGRLLHHPCAIQEDEKEKS